MKTERSLLIRNWFAISLKAICSHRRLLILNSNILKCDVILWFLTQWCFLLLTSRVCVCVCVRARARLVFFNSLHIYLALCFFPLILSDLTRGTPPWLDLVCFMLNQENGSRREQMSDTVGCDGVGLRTQLTKIVYITIDSFPLQN